MNTDKGYRFKDEYKCLMERGWSSNGKNDALWRTSLALLAYGNDEFWSGVMACIKNPDRTNGILRHPELTGKNDTSRDQIVMMLTAVHLTDYYVAMTIAEDIPRKISDRYSFWYDGMDWVSMISGNSSGLFYSFCSIFNMLPRLVNFPLKWLGIKSERWYPNFYTVHLTAWMLYVTPDNIFKKIAQRIIALATPKSNLLIMGLIGKPLNNGSQTLKGVPLKKFFQWQRLPWVNYHGIDTTTVLSEEEAGYALDRDILKIFL